MEDARQLANRAGSIVPMPELTQANKTQLHEISLGRVLLSEGLIAGCLMSPLDTASVPAIQQELGLIAGKKVKEELCNATLLAAAREFLG